MGSTLGNWRGNSPSHKGEESKSRGSETSDTLNSSLTPPLSPILSLFHRHTCTEAFCTATRGKYSVGLRHVIPVFKTDPSQKWPEAKRSTSPCLKQTHTHMLDSMPTHVRGCRHAQLQSTVEEVALAPSISQAPGSRDMLRVTCVRVGVRCVLRGAGDCTMNMMFSATVSRLSTSTPLKRGTATMAAIMRKSSKPLHKRRVLTN